MNMTPFKGFEFEGIWIEDPFLCEQGMDDVDPMEYYGIDIEQGNDGEWYCRNPT